MIAARDLPRKVARRATRVVRGPYYYDWNFYPRIARDDVYLISYPRSGSTWIRALVASFLTGGPVTPDEVQEVVPEIYKSRLSGTIARRYVDGKLLLKSHAPYRPIPARVVYLVRDGRDALLSYYYYLRKQNERLDGRDGAFAAGPAASFFLTPPPSPFGTWHEHVLGWVAGLERLPAGRSLVVRYEDVRGDPERELAQILAFAGAEPDAARVARAVDLNTKERMIEMERASGHGGWEFPGLTPTTWREALAPAEVAAYEELAGAALTRAGYVLAAE